MSNMTKTAETSEELAFSLWELATEEATDNMEALQNVKQWLLTSLEISKEQPTKLSHLVPAALVIINDLIALEETKGNVTKEEEMKEETKETELQPAEVLELADQVILSVDRADVEEYININNRVKMRKCIKALGAAAEAKPVVGSYREDGQDKASVESSVWVRTSKRAIKYLADTACNKFNQDCVLILSSTMQAYLYNPEWCMHLGTMQQISELEAKTTDCYTYDGNVYWFAK